MFLTQNFCELKQFAVEFLTYLGGVGKVLTCVIIFGRMFDKSEASYKNSNKTFEMFCV